MKKTTIVILAVIVIIILGFFGYKLFSSKVSQGFIDKHNEIVALGKEAEQVSDLTNMPEMEALDKQMENEDYAGALKSVQAALDRKNETAAKLDSVDKKLAELGALASQISDSAVKAGADKFVDMSKKENSAKIKYNNLQIQMLEKTKTMVGLLAKSKTISAADAKTVNALAKEVETFKSQVDDAQKEVDNIQSQYKQMEKEFFGLAGLASK
jgi:hypothetical protein